MWTMVDAAINGLMRMLLAAVFVAGAALHAGADEVHEGADIVILTTDFVLDAKFDAFAEAAAAEQLSIAAYRAGEAAPAEVARALSGAELVLIDAPRPNDYARIQQIFESVLADHSGPRVEVGGGRHAAQALDDEHARMLGRYYLNGTRVNFARMLRFWNVEVVGRAQGEVEPPFEFPSHGIYHPELESMVVATPSEYRKWLGSNGRSLDEATGVIGIVMSQNDIGNEQTAMLDALVERIEARGAVPWIFYYGGRDPEGISRMVADDDGVHVDVVVNMTHMFGVEDRPRELAALNVPLLQAFTYRDGDVADWRADTTGIPMRSLPAFLAIPEQMGAQDAMVIAAMDNGDLGLIEEQANAFLDRAIRLSQLRRTPNASKRLALMFWSYPPGERGVSASNLNVPRSLERLLDELAERGYRVDPVAADTLEEVLPTLLDPWQGRESAARWKGEHEHWGTLPVADYEDWLESVPAAARERLLDYHGAPGNDPMVVTGEDGEPVFLVPSMRSGAMLVLPQPARSGGNLHDGTVPPGHAYLATYLYVREHHEADALIHFGTHGTQEFLPGKERGLWAYDDALLALGDLAVVYPYISDNIGEALQAKRRGRAVTITHQPPPFAPAGLHGELYGIHELIHDWEMLDEGPVRDRVEAEVIERIAGENLYRDLGWDRDEMAADFRAFERVLHDYLHELAADSQPLGLHVFGGHPEPGHRVSTVMQMLGSAFYDALDLDEPDELFVDDYRNLDQSEPYRFLARFLLDGESPERVEDPVLRAFAEQALAWDHALVEHREIAGLLLALEGGFVPPTVGGDPIRNPDVLPTGRNLFGFDPARLPTERAWEVGREMAEDLVQTHYDRHGRYPTRLAFSLWSSEAMRHQGVMEAQMLKLLGLRPQWDSAGRLNGLAMIPDDELGRPRVDVVVSVTGVYRDQFPHFIERFAEGIAALSEHDAPDNPVARATRALAGRLAGNGTDAESARRLASIRIFSGESGGYGTGVPGNVFDTEGWEEDSELAETYLERMQYGYGAGGNWNVRLDGVNLYAEHLRDAEGAVLARSSNLHGLLSTDHPFEYLGGIAMAVRHLSGRSPDMYIANLRNPEGGRLVDAARYLSSELRSRYQHPGWIEAMQAEGYAGTLELLNIVNNFFGWQVTEPSMTRDDQWDAFHDIYVADGLDLGLEEWFAEHNPQALTRILERMLEAVRREYWDASEAIVRDLVERHQKLTDGAGAEGRLGEFVESLAVGFGLSAPQDAQAASGTARTVTGQVMQPVAPGEPAAGAPALLAPLIALLLALLVVTGAMGQWLQSRRPNGDPRATQRFLTRTEPAR